MTVSDVVSMDGAEALQHGGGVRDAGRAADVLHSLHLTDTPLEDTAKEAQPLFRLSLVYLLIYNKYLSNFFSVLKSKATFPLYGSGSTLLAFFGFPSCKRTWYLCFFFLLVN